jgi:hypothetical protein
MRKRGGKNGFHNRFVQQSLKLLENDGEKFLTEIKYFSPSDCSFLNFLGRFSPVTGCCEVLPIQMWAAAPEDMR